MPRRTQAGTTDPELEAIASIVAALTPLDEGSQRRVIEYALRRFGLDTAASLRSDTTEGSEFQAPGPSSESALADIRSLREAKKPRSANEMAAIVAFYLEYAAPTTERKTEISAADIKKYFHQANFRLPAKAAMTLVNAKNAGYFDTGSTRATYRLNPVGYNLVAHRLPSSDSTSTSGWSAPASSKRRKTVARKPRVKTTRASSRQTNR